MTEKVKINNAKDFLILVDLQGDFIDGSLAVAGAKDIIDRINDYIKLFLRKVFTQDWHPANHCSFVEQGGPWPPHCVAGTPGADIYNAINTGTYLDIAIYKATTQDTDAYSGFEGTDLENILNAVNKDGALFICGLATDYCVKFTVLDALKTGRKVYVLTDACAAVNVNPGDGESALTEMVQAGATLATLNDLEVI